ncbi:transketolase [Propionivibrio dicarboxylicus]|uniref:Transketolase n=1 Tax=Propionivibrio dicarboxylicus TaxID=83767 RepID=A0A1G8HTD6_9RHOO|nr:transketolase [Propionivibrio dicarboxylicus]SDI09761.1 transketolase [Propionivibrio dicarboxylicus]
MADFEKLDVQELKDMARTIRQDIVKMVHAAGSGHPGGSLSATDIMTALYFNVLNLDPQQPKWKGRDRFVLSKGHCCPVLYSVLARRGFIDVSDLTTLRKYGSKLQGHPDMHKCPGVEMSAGSLGNGIGCAVGMAIAAKVRQEDHKVFVLLGDGECQEGSVWEAAMCGAHHQLGNLIAIVDVNRLQILDTTDKVMKIDPLADKWRSFGWKVLEIDGHDMAQVLDTLNYAKSIDGPVAILAATVKGKGVSFMEDVIKWHGAAPSEKELGLALSEIEGAAK